ncbi:MAG: S-layer homology domain-containing protein [Oscillospiraceae bacterium]|nr:S-layer homology domain-containing protein [Oscillospiraceae bacterium]
MGEAVKVDDHIPNRITTYSTLAQALDEDKGGKHVIVNADQTISANLTVVPAGKTLEIAEDATLTVPNGAILEFEVGSFLTGPGKISVASGGIIIVPHELHPLFAAPGGPGGGIDVNAGGTFVLSTPTVPWVWIGNDFTDYTDLNAASTGKPDLELTAGYVAIVPTISGAAPQGTLTLNGNATIRGFGYTPDTTNVAPVEIKAGQTLVVPATRTLTIPEGASLKVDGTLTNNGTIGLQTRNQIIGDVGGDLRYPPGPSESQDGSDVGLFPTTPPSTGDGEEGEDGEGEPETTVEVELSEEAIAEIVEAVEEAVADALEAIAEALEAESGETVVVAVEIDLGVEVTDDTTTVTAPVPEEIAAAIVEALEAIEEALEDGASVDFSVTLDLGLVSLTLDLDALVEIFGAGETVVLEVALVAADDLDEDAAALVGDRPVYGFSVLVNDEAVTEFGGGTISIAIPYELGAGEDPNAIVVYYLNADGELDVIRGYYEDGFVYFITDHFSKFVVGYNPVTFTDADDIPTWAAGNILFSASRKLFVGNGGAFMPDMNVSYQQLAAVLSNYLGLGAELDWDTGGHITWGEAFGIFAGLDIEDYTVAATRADVAVILYNFIVKSGIKVSAIDDAPSFSDIGDLDDVYVTAIEYIAAIGVTAGTEGGTKYSPDMTLTRAQVSSFITNIVKAFGG